MFRRIASLTTLLMIYGGTAQAATTLNLSAYLPSGHPLVSEGMAEWAKDVEEASKGEISIRILPTALGKPEAHFEMARDGITDVALGIPGYTPGRFVLADVGGVPNVANTATGLSVGLWNTYASSPEMQKEFEGVTTLGLFTTSPMHFFNTKREINSVEDFKGMKARSAGGLMTEVEKALGMVPLLQPVGKTYELLSGGVADAVINPLETVKSMKFDQLIEYATVIPGGLTAAPIFLVMNTEKFEALPKEAQDALISVSGAHLSRIIGGVWDRHDEEGLTALKAAGAEVKTTGPELTEQIFAATEPAVEAWAAGVKEKRGVDGLALVRTLRAEVAKAESR